MSDTELQPRRGPGRPSNAELASRDQAAVELPRRANRIPFGSLEQKLAWPPREGYRRYWFKDSPGRVQRALEAGYEHVKNKEGKNVSRITGVAEGGGAENSYLMEIPMEWFLEDMAREQKLIDEREAAMKRGATQGAEVEHGYVPSQGISIR